MDDPCVEAGARRATRDAIAPCARFLVVGDRLACISSDRACGAAPMEPMAFRDVPDVA